MKNEIKIAEDIIKQQSEINFVNFIGANHPDPDFAMREFNQLCIMAEEYAEFKMKQAVSEREVYVSALEDCGNKILDAVGQGETPHRQIKGLRILLNRPFKNIE